MVLFTRITCTGWLLSYENEYLFKSYAWAVKLGVKLVKLCSMASRTASSTDVFVLGTPVFWTPQINIFLTTCTIERKNWGKKNIFYATNIVRTTLTTKARDQWVMLVFLCNWWTFTSQSLLWRHRRQILEEDWNILLGMSCTVDVSLVISIAVCLLLTLASTWEIFCSMCFRSSTFTRERFRLHVAFGVITGRLQSDCRESFPRNQSWDFWSVPKWSLGGYDCHASHGGSVGGVSEEIIISSQWRDYFWWLRHSGQDPERVWHRSFKEDCVFMMNRESKS